MKDHLLRGIITSREKALAVALATLITLSLGTIFVQAGGVARWGATTFQLYNLGTQDAPITVTFYDDYGNKALTFNDILPAGGTKFYEPEQTPPGLPPTFTGQLYVSSTHQVFGLVHHFAPLADPADGNAIHRLLDTDDPNTTFYLPYVDWDHEGWFTVIRLLNTHEEIVDANVTYFDQDGSPVGAYVVPIDARATAIANPPPVTSFVGSARVQASNPILVTVSHRRNGHDLTHYNGQTIRSRYLRAPYVHGQQSFVAVQNVGSAAAQVQVTFHWPQTETLSTTVAPMASHIFTSTLGNPQGHALVTGTQPLVALVMTEKVSDGAASRSYAALSLDRASRCAVVPSVLDDYEGWHTTLWIQNFDPAAQVVEVMFTAAPTGTRTYRYTPLLAPGEVYAMPADAFQHAAALVMGSGKVGVIAQQVNASVPDGIMDYEGYTASDPCVVPRIYLPLAMKDHADH